MKIYSLVLILFFYVEYSQCLAQENVILKDTTNLVDANGMKQGTWTRYWRGTLVEIKTYKNDTLEGYYMNHEYMPTEGQYKKGKKEGVFYSYYDNKKTKILSINFYQNGIYTWTAFYTSALVPEKPFHINKGTVEVKVPHKNNKTWYLGTFVKTRNYKGRIFRQDRTFPIGIHYIYFASGQLSGVVDYDKEMIKKYNSKGLLLYDVKFTDFTIHKQSMLANYIKDK